MGTSESEGSAGESDAAQDGFVDEAGEGIATGDRPSRRRLLKAAAATGTALWVAPTVLAFDASPAAASTCSCGGATTAQRLLTQQARVAGTPTACATPSGTVVFSTFCRADSTASVYLWGEGTLATGTNGPLLDDIGVLTVTESSTGTVRIGNIYRFQNFCRQGANVPTNSVLSNVSQRVYTGADLNTWDYLPPQPTPPPTDTGGLAQTADPTSWWDASQPNGSPTATDSVGNPGYTPTAAFWPGPIDVSLLFGNSCGQFTVAFENRNRYEEYKWSDILIGSTPPP